MINEMSPYLLPGFFIVSVLHSFVPAKFYSHLLMSDNDCCCHK